MKCDRKVLLVGWDAADWKIVHQLMDCGLMPATRQLVDGGVMANILTLSPVLSPMLWTSIATGKRPYKHGIYGFTEPLPDGRGIRPVTNLSRNTKAIWNILSQSDKKCNVVGWWPSSPAEPINGVMVSNHYQRSPNPLQREWPVAPGTIHPARLTETLAELRIHPQDITPENVLPFVPLGAKIDQDKDRRLSGIIKIIADCASIQSAATWLMQEEPWDFMAVYFDAIDHFCHGFMRYHPPRLDWVSESDFEMYQNVVTAGYVLHDMMLARLVELAGDQTTVILMSDHGFHSDHLRRRTVPNEPAGPAAEHREHGIFVMRGPGIKRDQLVHGVSLLDVTPTVLALFDLPIGQDMDGLPVKNAFETPPTIEMIPSWDQVEGPAGLHPADRQLEDSESASAIEQLVALGYIERPNQDGGKAARDSQRELDYNLARAYIDGGQHGMAVPLLFNLYKDNPLEFRFGIQLAMCLQALQLVDELADLVDDLKQRWQVSSQAARKQIREIQQLAEQRRAKQQVNRSQASGTENVADTEDSSSDESIFSPAEQHVINKTRKLCVGNPHTLDYMSGWVAMARENYSEAVKHFQVAEQSSSMSSGFYYQLAEAWRRMKRYDEAQREFERVLELDPHNPGAHLGLARIALSRGQTKQALELGRLALGLRYHMPVAHYVIGRCEKRQGNFPEAVAALETALELNPNFHEAHTQLAKIHEQWSMDTHQARVHRRQAEQIRIEIRQQATTRILSDLPSYDSINYQDHLPQFPEPPDNSRRLPPLAQKPLDQDQPASDDQPSATDTILIVSGLPRSGTSMMMQMLSAAGISPYTDGQREADENNPNGYFELEQVKALATANDWLDQACGKSLKVISPLIPFLPQGHCYRVVMMQRDLNEIVASQSTMLDRMQEDKPDISSEKLTEFLKGQFEMSRQLLEAHGIPVLVVSHAQAILKPDLVAQQVAEFIDRPDATQAMSGVVDTRLHRERSEDAA